MQVEKLKKYLDNAPEVGGRERQYKRKTRANAQVLKRFQ